MTGQMNNPYKQVTSEWTNSSAWRTWIRYGCENTTASPTSSSKSTVIGATSVCTKRVDVSSLLKCSTSSTTNSFRFCSVRLKNTEVLQTSWSHCYNKNNKEITTHLCYFIQARSWPSRWGWTHWRRATFTDTTITSTPALPILLRQPPSGFTTAWLRYTSLMHTNECLEGDSMLFRYRI